MGAKVGSLSWGVGAAANVDEANVQIRLFDIDQIRLEVKELAVSRNRNSDHFLVPKLPTKKKNSCSLGRGARWVGGSIPPKESY